MPPTKSQHPVHLICSAGGLLCVFLLLARSHSPIKSINQVTFQPSINGLSTDISLQKRLVRSEVIYQRARARRRELQAKFGKNTDPYPVENYQIGYPSATWWDFVYPSFNCPFDVERIGAVGDGGKWVCGMSLIEQMDSCVVYSFGINYESSFEAEMLERAPGCQIWGYDFSVKSFGPEIMDKSALTSRAHFKAYGLAGKDAHGSNDDPQMYTLESLMRINGHTFIDVLKIDIETFEFETLTDLLKQYSGQPLPFGQLQIEIHAWKSHFPVYQKLLDWWEALEDAGLRPFMNEANLVYINYSPGSPPELQEYSFLNVKGNHRLIN